MYTPAADTVAITTNGLWKAQFRNADNLIRYGLKFLEQADAVSDTAAYGQVWVHNDAPCTLWFTDDTGVDFEVGYKHIPVNERSGSYTIVKADNGKMVYRNTANTLVAFTMPVSMPTGYVVTVWNRHASSVVVTRSSTDTFRLVGGDGTGETSVTIPQNNMATFHKYASTSWVVQGSSGVS